MSESVSIIVPVFNEVRTVANVVERLRAIPLPIDREIIVVNDGSSDGTRELLNKLSAEDPALMVVHSPENRGKGHAMRIGLARARGTIVAIQDADLELDPVQIGSLLAPILEGETNVVYGSRFLAGKPAAPPLTIAANRFLTQLTNVMYGSSLTDMETCYKVMRREVAQDLALTADRFDIEPEITVKLLRSGQRIVERPVTFSPRSNAAGKKLRWRDGVMALRVLWRHRRSR